VVQRLPALLPEVRHRGGVCLTCDSGGQRVFGYCWVVMLLAPDGYVGGGG
jgi:hypothetical protein